MAAVAKSGLPSYYEGRTTFLGARIPPEVEVMVKQMKKLDRDIFRRILKVVVSALEGQDCQESVKHLSENVSLSEEQLSYILSGMYTLIREALRLPMSTFKPEVFKEDLRELSVPEDCITDFSSVVFGSRRSVLETAAGQQGTRLPCLEDFRWRVDVAVSTSSLARALQPSILMQMKLSDGNAHQFEVPISKFQELRYNVALLLKEMNDLEKRNILKIQD
ncbi:COMM domain-containing protein 5 isoform X1 [Protopterus annectens]|uniref:COMM domain-containing protein 5 isoform X1 n=1 Tax=Protopterus annectens TaxID=7888 RepID=UPI001CFA5AE9|nr:COMM domain-containing protein 5 isoform X1 [Protopterus annectens]